MVLFQTNAWYLLKLSFLKEHRTQEAAEPVGQEDTYKLRVKALLAIWQPKEYWRDDNE